jgi:hypothetical protein
VRPSSRRAGRALAGAALAALALVAAGCGDDDEEPAATTETQSPTVADTGPAETSTQAEGTESEAEPPETEAGPESGETEAESEPGETEPPASPEDQPGGAGDEEPARSLALFTGRDRRITPRVVRVPAYISIRVELRSTDAGDYGLTFDGETIEVSAGLGSVSTTIDGLRPGEAVVGTPTGVGNRVRIEATAEPGP